MELAAILGARVVSLVQFEELDPRNRVGRKHLANEVAARYAFESFPKTLEELGLDKGIAFRVGKLDAINIESIYFFKGAVAVETRSSTDDSERVAENLLAWLSERAGSTARVVGRLFTSTVTFRSRNALPSLGPQVEALLSSVRKQAAEDFGPSRIVHPYQTISVEFDYDQSLSRLHPGRIAIQRRAGVPFAESLFWSEAPLRTNDHIAFLEQFERAVHGA